MFPLQGAKGIIPVFFLLLLILPLFLILALVVVLVFILILIQVSLCSLQPGIAYSSIKKLLMVESGKETNPGPSKENCTNENIFLDDEDTDEVVDMKSFPESNEVLKTSKLKCDICGVGDIVKVNSNKKN